MRLLRRNAPSVPAALQRPASAKSARFSPAENLRRRAIATTSGMPGLNVDGSWFIEESSTAAMSDTTLDCKFQKAGVPGYIGTGGMGWWGFTFPLGVYAASTLQLARETGFADFQIFGALLVIQLGVFWTVVTLRTFHGMWHGYLFHAPCLSSETGLISDEPDTPG